jgi:hypothetical protein
MKDKEFVKKIKALGYKIQKTTPSGVYFQITDMDGSVLLWVAREATFSINNQDVSFGELSFDEQSNLMKVALKYIATPIDDRKEEPHFKVKIFPGSDLNVTDWFLGEGKGQSLRTSVNALVFTPDSYQEYCNNHPGWLAFLPDYVAENTDSFIPVESGDPDD